MSLATILKTLTPLTTGIKSTRAGFNQPLEPIHYPEEAYTTKYIEQGFEKWLSEVRSAIDEQLQLYGLFQQALSGLLYLMR